MQTGKVTPVDGKRRFSRVPLRALCLMTDQGHSKLVNLIDISLKGALFEITDGLPILIGKKCFLTITLIPALINLDFDAEVVHVNDALVGVRFEQMDLDTLIHLRAVLEANTGAPDRIRDELEFLMERE